VDNGGRPAQRPREAAAGDQRQQPQQPHQQQPQPRARNRPQDRPEPARVQKAPGPAEDGEQRSSGWLRRALVAALVLSAICAGGWFAFSKREQLLALAGIGGKPAKQVASSVQPTVLETPPVPEKAPERVSPPAMTAADLRFDGAESAIDQEMQKAPVWRLVRTEFPDWYAKRVQDAGKQRAERKDDRQVFRADIAALVDLRRKYQADALGSSLPRLRAIASTFLGNVVHLRKVSIDACYGYISQGETSPVVVDLLQASDHGNILMRQLVTVFEAIAEGRKTPKAYPAPKAADFDILAQELSGRGWKEADMRLFADPKALAREKPERVCQMLQDWFAAQLAVKDPDIQLRLLVDALRPVVAG